MALKAGHEDCETCNVCGLPWCPDCDTEGRCCSSVHEPETEMERVASVDYPFYRPKPRKRRGK